MTRSILAALLATFALVAPANAIDMSALNDAERAALRAEIRSYLLENPDVIMEAVAILETREAEQKAKDDLALVKVNAQDIFDDPNSWVGGNPDGDFTMVEFVDYRCGYCRKAHDEVAQLLETDGNIRIIIKEYPILGEASVKSSRFAIATRLVAGDEAYKSVGDALIKFKGNVNTPALRRIGETLELDVDAIMDKADSDEVTQIIGENHALAKRLKISGTPSFVMGDRLMRGYMPLDYMLAVVDEARAEK